MFKIIVNYYLAKLTKTGWIKIKFTKNSEIIGVLPVIFFIYFSTIDYNLIAAFSCASIKDLTVKFLNVSFCFLHKIEFYRKLSQNAHAKKKLSNA